MKIVDLTGKYIDSVLVKKDVDQYYSYYPSLFEHYFSFWANKKINNKITVEAAVRNAIKLIEESLSKIEVAFKNVGMNLENVTLIVFVGLDTSNGHAFFNDGHFIVWLPVETYKTQKMADVFIAHEIAHALQYEKSPDLYFLNIEEKNSTGRQLMTEGVATFVSKQIMGLSEREALWADFLTLEQYDQWLQQCEKKIAELAVVSLAHWNKHDLADLFMANDSRDILTFRGGYYLSLKMIEYIVRVYDLSPVKLLSLPKKWLEGKCLEYLSSFKEKSRLII